MQQKQPRLAVSLSEAAEILGVSMDFFSQHIVHDLRIVYKGRRQLIAVSELQAWLEREAIRTK